MLSRSRLLPHISSLMCKRTFKTNGCRAVLFDIDGVLIRGKKKIKGATESLIRLQEARIPFAFLTNGGGVLESVKTKQLMDILNEEQAKKIELSPEHMILSHSPMKALLDKHRGDKILIIGDHDSAKVAREYGFTNAVGVKDFFHQNPHIHAKSANKVKMSTIEQSVKEYEENNLTQPFKAVFVMHDPEDFGRDLQICMDVLLSRGSPGSPFHLDDQEVDLYMSNPDLLYSGTYSTPRFGQGLFKLCLQSVYKEMNKRDLRLNQFGKPEKVTYEFAEKKLEKIASELGYNKVDVIYAVGDNPAADVRGANNAGHHYQSVLVRTGVFSSPESNDRADPAKHVVQDVNEFVDKLINKGL
ncbi:CDP-alcohol phosphatidyltransferase class-I family protein [Acrasis kona]|uniref:CDP-alcohol phosphatidyltransferase n=1 Tax=Acrasis kona TaxID=1008807 RepID=A0AAW2ZD90_9EUKA